eukprot:CAMPEP_0203940948 /NCGR_PEP_ID=MMETSP0359-20131031/77420_1 /ASSEMBLY_ACC=CAM_ASM_000338 /TAXON_ID=268821 /ORGANISM="Scrippsiella Hangoei, Strain SHTV-5" /LENGTH=154 /DNA_ID=CAMNT_0050871439 /DNA_START=70 /DNA_END=530 /DNA_ORIENTATION=+
MEGSLLQQVAAHATAAGCDGQFMLCSFAPAAPASAEALLSKLSPGASLCLTVSCCCCSSGSGCRAVTAAAAGSTIKDVRCTTFNMALDGFASLALGEVRGVVVDLGRPGHADVGADGPDGPEPWPGAWADFRPGARSAAWLQAADASALAAALR